MNIPKFSVKRPVTVIMALLIVAALGVISVTSLSTALFPDMNLPYAVIFTSYEGASPERVETMVTKPIENTMATVSNVKSIQSVSSEGNSSVILEFNTSTNMDSAMIDMREMLDMIKGYFPAEVGSPRIMKLNPDMMPILNFSISVEDMDISEATYWVDDEILPRIERIEGVATLSMSGGAQNEVQITLDSSQIDDINDEINQDVADNASRQMLDDINAQREEAGLGALTMEEAELPEMDIPNQTFISYDSVKNILQGQNFQMPSGYVNESESLYLVRVGDKLEDMDAVSDLVVFKSDDKTVRISDIAEVELVDTAGESYSKVNGEPALTVSVQKQNNYATTDVVKAVSEEFDAIRDEFDGVEIVTLMDQGEYIDMAVGSVANNLIYGGILAIIILLIFLRDLKPTFVVGVAIPISLLAAFILIYFMDITLNIVSMGGLALGIGMLVDNSIVVIENIYRIRSKGKDAKYSAVTGAKQVAGAITASTLTTVSVFLPIVFLEGMTADIFKEMAWTISASLIASLAIALTFVPMAASQLLKNGRKRKKSKLMKRVTKGYKKLLKGALHHKAAVMIVTVLLFAASIYGSLQIGTEYFPESDTGQVSITVNMPLGSSFDETADVLDEATQRIMKIEEVETVGASMGGNALGMGGPMGSDASTIDVLLKEDGDYKTSEIEQQIRDDLDGLDAEFEINGQAMSLSAMMGSGISVDIRGMEFSELENLSQQVADIIAQVEGTTEIDNGISKEEPAVKITVDKDEAIKNGLTTAQVYMAVDSAVNPNNKASELTLGSRDYDIMVLEDSNGELDLDELKKLELQTPAGETVELSDVADITTESGYASITRMDQERTITVTAALEEGYNIGLVGDEVQEKLDELDIPEGYTVELTGENEEINSALRDLTLALAMAVALIYMIMAAQFESFKYPFIVMFAIPLAFTGGFLALIVTNTPLSVVALIGMIILAGIVVNNGIVLVDYINQLKARGMDPHKAIIKAGKTRLRPIVMTALTTIFALSTLSVGFGRGSEMMQPLAITAIGGLIFSTALTLIVVPVMYAAFDGISKKRKTEQDETPAITEA
jgi:HAE1 family hydrophobic/amphiphilic exporter-1